MTQDLRAQLLKLQQERDQLQSSVAVCSARLEAAGVGMQGPLLDHEGFPRADIDIATIRSDRQRVIMLSNDHKALTGRMEKLLHLLHAESREAGGGSSASAASSAEAAPASRPAAPGSDAAPAVVSTQLGPRAIAMVDEVSPGSPAAAAGICPGDQLLQFGAVSAQTPSPLQALGAELQASEGQAVETKWRRHGSDLTIILTPQQWGGRGLLGCHLRPL